MRKGYSNECATYKPVSVCFFLRAADLDPCIYTAHIGLGVQASAVGAKWEHEVVWARGDEADHFCTGDCADCKHAGRGLATCRASLSAISLYHLDWRHEQEAAQFCAGVAGSDGSSGRDKLGLA